MRTKAAYLGVNDPREKSTIFFFERENLLSNKKLPFFDVLPHFPNF